MIAVTPAKGGTKVVPIPLVGDEAVTQHDFAMRLLVDRPVTEVYSQGGRLRLSAPMRLNHSTFGGGVRVFGPDGIVATVSAWKMGSAFTTTSSAPLG